MFVLALRMDESLHDCFLYTASLLDPDEDIFFVFRAGECSGDESGGDVVGGVGGSPLSSLKQVGDFGDLLWLCVLSMLSLLLSCSSFSWDSVPSLPI